MIGVEGIKMENKITKLKSMTTLPEKEFSSFLASLLNPAQIERSSMLLVEINQSVTLEFQIS